MVTRDGSRTAATSKMERFVIIVIGWKPLTVITKCSILDVVAVLDPPLVTLKQVFSYSEVFMWFEYKTGSDLVHLSTCEIHKKLTKFIKVTTRTLTQQHCFCQ